MSSISNKVPKATFNPQSGINDSSSQLFNPLLAKMLTKKISQNPGSDQNQNKIWDVQNWDKHSVAKTAIICRGFINLFQRQDTVVSFWPRPINSRTDRFHSTYISKHVINIGQYFSSTTFDLDAISLKMQTFCTSRNQPRIFHDDTNHNIFTPLNDLIKSNSLFSNFKEISLWEIPNLSIDPEIRNIWKIWKSLS